MFFKGTRVMRKMESHLFLQHHLVLVKTAQTITVLLMKHIVQITRHQFPGRSMRNNVMCMQVCLNT